MDYSPADLVFTTERHFIPEIIDPITNQRLPDGEMGELVFTCVTKEALPLIRYRTRDRIVVDRTTDYMDELDVLVEAPAQIYSNQERLVQLEKRLSYDVQSALGITCKVKLVGPREIPRSEGKAVRVVDKRKM